MGGKSDARITDFCLVHHTLSMIRNITPVLLLEKSFESNYVLRNSGVLFGYQNNDSESLTSGTKFCKLLTRVNQGDNIL